MNVTAAPRSITLTANAPVRPAVVAAVNVIFRNSMTPLNPEELAIAIVSTPVPVPEVLSVACALAAPSVWLTKLITLGSHVTCKVAAPSFSVEVRISTTIDTVNVVSVLRSNRGTDAVTTGAPILPTITSAESLAAALSTDVATRNVCPLRTPVTVDVPAVAIEGLRVVTEIGALAIAFPAWSNAASAGVTVPAESTTSSRLVNRTLATGLVLVAVKVTVGVARPVRVAVAVFTTPIVEPSVHRAAARPSASVTRLDGETKA